MSCLAVKNVVKLSVTNLKPIFPWENCQKNCHQNSTTFSIPKFQNFTTLSFWDRSRIRTLYIGKSRGKLLEELSRPLVHMNFPRKRYGPMIGPYEFPQEKVWTNDWSIWTSPKIRMDQWRSKSSESFSLDRYWFIDGSSLLQLQYTKFSDI